VDERSGSRKVNLAQRAVSRSFLGRGFCDFSQREYPEEYISTSFEDIVTRIQEAMARFDDILRPVRGIAVLRAVTCFACWNRWEPAV
jgi:hypothetical protein